MVRDYIVICIVYVYAPLQIPIHSLAYVPSLYDLSAITNS